MAKYDERFKVKVVKDYLSGSLGFRALAAVHGLRHGTVERWVNGYREHGALGLRRKGASYDEAFKLKVLKRMWQKHWTQAKTAAVFDIRSAAHIGKWARQYDEGGIDALRSRRKGPRMTTSNKPPKPTSSVAELDDKQIIARQNKELILLRAEVAYLKKLDALIQEKRAAAQKKRKP
jgi:transposase